MYSSQSRAPYALAVDIIEGSIRCSSIAGSEPPLLTLPSGRDRKAFQLIDQSSIESSIAALDFLIRPQVPPERIVFGNFSDPFATSTTQLDHALKTLEHLVSLGVAPVCVQSRSPLVSLSVPLIKGRGEITLAIETSGSPDQISTTVNDLMKLARGLESSKIFRRIQFCPVSESLISRNACEIFCRALRDCSEQIRLTPVAGIKRLKYGGFRQGDSVCTRLFTLYQEALKKPAPVGLPARAAA